MWGGAGAPSPGRDYKGEASAAGGGAGPWRVSAPAPAARAAAGWEEAPQRPRPPPRALPQSPLLRQPQSRHRPLLPAPPQALRLAQLGDDGRGLAATWWGGGGSAAVLLPGFPPACDLTSPQLGLQYSGTPLGRWFSAFPGRTPGFRAGAGSTPGTESGPDPPLEPWLTLGSSGSYNSVRCWAPRGPENLRQTVVHSSSAYIVGVQYVANISGVQGAFALGR